MELLFQKSNNYLCSNNRSWVGSTEKRVFSGFFKRKKLLKFGYSPPKEKAFRRIYGYSTTISERIRAKPVKYNHPRKRGFQTKTAFQVGIIAVLGKAVLTSEQDETIYNEYKTAIYTALRYPLRSGSE
jgi:hypothetical protein